MRYPSRWPAPRSRRARPVEAPPAAADVGDDVPLLTDEVEEIDAVAIDAAVHEGEPSAWLDFDAAEPSVIGDAPDSIAIVPPVDLRRPEPPSEVDEFDELDDELAAAIAAAPPEDETLQPPRRLRWFRSRRRHRTAGPDRTRNPRRINLLSLPVARPHCCTGTWPPSLPRMFQRLNLWLRRRPCVAG